MKFINKNEEKQEINKGDLVSFKGEICLVVFNYETFVAGVLGSRIVEFPYELVSLNSGDVVNSFKGLEGMKNDPNVRFLSANEDIELHY